MPFPGRRDDFETNEAFVHWRTQETAHLQQLMLAMVQFNPELRKDIPTEPTSTPYSPPQRPTSMYASSSTAVDGSSNYTASLDTIVDNSLASDEEVELGHNFTYIPPNPKKFYKRLLELCIQFDLEAMVHLPEDQEMSWTILSPRYLEVLNDCTLRWRINHPYRVTCFLDVIRYRYEQDEVPIECVSEALEHVGGAIHDLGLNKWSRFDVSLLHADFAHKDVTVRFTLLSGRLRLHCVRRLVQRLPWRPVRGARRHHQTENRPTQAVRRHPRVRTRLRPGRSLQSRYRGAAERPCGPREDPSRASVHG